MNAHVIGPSEIGRSQQGFATGRPHEAAVARQLIPVVFVPGIMGSRLEATTDDDDEGITRWDPDDKLFMGRKFLSIVGPNSAAKRKLLIGSKDHEFGSEYLRPLMNGGSHIKAHAISRREVARGWAGVYWTLYGPFLRALT